MKLLFLCLLVALTLISCSQNENDLLKEARAAEDQKNFQVAVERYQELVDRFPGSAKAESCLTRIAVISSDELHDAARAVSAYKQFYTMFPSSKNAPSALFLTGFLFSNELHKLDSAKIAYESFLQKYPNDALAASAKFELETLGKDPGDFLHSGTLSGEGAEPPDSTVTLSQ